MPVALCLYFLLQRGVCARAFAPGTSQENDECHQICMNSTICEEMCDATASLPSSEGKSVQKIKANEWHNNQCPS